jgi:uncharacterized membrane protein
MLLGLLLLLGIPTVLVVAGALLWTNRTQVGEHANAGGTAATPRQILDKRLSRGELDIEEYRRILSEIDKGEIA